MSATVAAVVPHHPSLEMARSLLIKFVAIAARELVSAHQLVPTVAELEVAAARALQLETPRKTLRLWLKSVHVAAAVAHLQWLVMVI